MLTNMARGKQKGELDHMSEVSPSNEYQELLCAACLNYKAWMWHTLTRQMWTGYKQIITNIGSLWQKLKHISVHIFFVIVWPIKYVWLIKMSGAIYKIDISIT